MCQFPDFLSKAGNKLSLCKPRTLCWNDPYLILEAFPELVILLSGLLDLVPCKNCLLHGVLKKTIFYIKLYYLFCQSSFPFTSCIAVILVTVIVCHICYQGVCLNWLHIEWSYDVLPIWKLFLKKRRNLELFLLYFCCAILSFISQSVCVRLFTFYILDIVTYKTHHRVGVRELVVDSDSKVLIYFCVLEGSWG